MESERISSVDDLNDIIREIRNDVDLSGGDDGNVFMNGKNIDHIADFLPFQYGSELYWIWVKIFWILYFIYIKKSIITQVYHWIWLVAMCIWKRTTNRLILAEFRRITTKIIAQWATIIPLIPNYHRKNEPLSNRAKYWRQNSRRPMLIRQIFLLLCPGNQVSFRLYPVNSDHCLCLVLTILNSAVSFYWILIGSPLFYRAFARFLPFQTDFRFVFFAIKINYGY